MWQAGSAGDKMCPRARTTRNHPLTRSKPPVGHFVSLSSATKGVGRGCGAAWGDSNDVCECSTHRLPPANPPSPAKSDWNHTRRACSQSTRPSSHHPYDQPPYCRCTSCCRHTAAQHHQRRSSYSFPEKSRSGAAGRGGEERSLDASRAQGIV